MAERTLTEKELNRAVLARQLLLERERLPIPRAVERMAGIQAQYAPSSYIGLWSRVDGFRRDHLTRALERKTVVQATLMRSTIHVVSRADYWPLADAIREERRRWWLRTWGRSVEPRDMQTLARRVRKLLADGPKKPNEIAAALGVAPAELDGLGGWLDLVRVPPSGTWERRRADLYRVAEDWLGPSTSTPERGLEVLIRRYLGGFGPASVKNLANWAGVSVSALAPALDRLRLRRFRDERGELLLDLLRAPLPGAEAPAPVRFLPTWDATLLAHARRAQILPEPYRPLVFSTKTPQSVTTFLVDGRVAGSWTFEGGRVKLAPFEPLPRAARRDLEEEGNRLAAFLS